MGATAVLLSAPAWAAPGDLDPSFSRDGLVTTSFGEASEADDVAIQSDGKIVVAGYAGDPRVAGDVALARYQPDGQLDPTFSSDGQLTDDFGGRDRSEGVAVQADGKIVVVGESFSDSSPPELVVARYEPDGSPDPSFSGDGKLTFDFGGAGDGVSDVALDSEGRIVVVGTKDYADVAVARFEPDGTPDMAFSGDGVTTVDFGGNSFGRAVAVEPDDGVVLGGTNEETNGYGTEEFALARLKPNGDLDSSFSDDGKALATIAGADNAEDIALQANGRIVVAGTGCTDSYYYGTCGADVARLAADGSLDTSFGDNGFKIVNTEGYAGSRGNALALTPDGGVTIAGNTLYDEEGGGAIDFALFRLDSNGSPDGDFRGGGIWTTDFLSGYDRAAAIALQDDGKIVVAGPSESDFALARYLVATGPRDADADGVLDRLDHCPTRFGADRFGCTHYRRSLSMENHRRQDLDVGVLKAREPECVDSATVRVYRERRGPDFLVDKAVTDYLGNWSIDARRHPGHYYALAQPSFGSAYGRCLKARASGFRI